MGNNISGTGNFCRFRFPKTNGGMTCRSLSCSEADTFEDKRQSINTVQYSDASTKRDPLIYVLTVAI